MSGKESKEANFDELEFRRIFTPIHIPKYLVEQVKDRDWEVDEWYKYQEIICLRNGEDGPTLNPLNFLYVISDADYRVVGMLWAEANPLSHTLVIQTFSMHKDYWYSQGSVKILSNKAKEIAKECKLKKILWSTKYPKHSERHGFKRSRSILMEFDMESQDGKDIHGGNSARRKHSSENSGTRAVLERNLRGDGPSSERSIPAISTAV